MTVISTNSPMDENLKGRLGPYSEISKTNFSEAYGPEHRSTVRDTFHFALSPDCPRSLGHVHERVDQEKGIKVDTDIMVEHIEEQD